MNIIHCKPKFLLPAVFFLLLSLTFLSISLFKNPKLEHPRKEIHITKHIQVFAESTCEGTLYPELCASTISTFPDLRQKSIPEIIAGIVNITVKEVRASETNCTGLRKVLRNLDPIDRRALDDCIELLGETVAELKKAINDLNSSTSSSSRHIADLNSLFSGAMTNQNTCLDGFAFGSKKVRKFIEGRIRKISRHVSNSLAMIKKIKKKKKKKNKKSQEEEEDFPLYGTKKDGFPTWLKKKDRALLQVPVNQLKFNLVVAKDKSGNFTTINEAIQASPNNSATRFVIYIKTGAYFEYVDVISKKTNIMLVGDGIGKTLIKGNRSVVDGWTTFRSSTVAAVGTGFIARGITFENYAGASKHQAVAVRSGSDFSAFYNCSFVGYQDTLYVHSFRQFYTQCDIYGTVDFIFGNAAVVFQQCNLYARKPDPNQSNIYTAQGRDDPNQNTGISIINSKVAAAADLIPVQSTFKTYLGRPWKIYSRTVYLLSNLNDVVDPKGWLEWDGTLGLNTLYYGEYKNRGPGSNTTQRVTWPGYRVITNATEASQFTVANFIEGTLWIPQTGFPFYLDLIPPS